MQDNVVKLNRKIRHRTKLGLILVCEVLFCLFIALGLVLTTDIGDSQAVGLPTQILFSGYHTAMTTGTTQYSSLQGALEWTVDANLRGQQSVSTSGTISNLYVTLSGAPGAGKNYTFTVMKNGAAQSLSVVISDAATSGFDSSHPVSVVAGDYVGIRKVPAGTPTAVSAKWSTTFTADAANESLVMCANWFYNGLATTYCPVSCAGYYSGSTTESPVWQVAPCSGTLDNLYITLVDGAPGAGTGWRCDLRVNGVSSNLTVTISDAATTGNDVIHKVYINEGDYLHYIIQIASGAPATRGAAIGMRFTSSVNGESMILGTNRNTNTANAVRYMYAQAGKDNLAWQSSEIPVELAQACTVRSLYVALSGSPGYYNYNTLTLDVNLAGSALTVTITGPATSGHDTTHTVSLANDDLIDMANIASSGTAQTVHWGMVCYVTPFTLPTVTTGAATNVEEQTATLNGEVTATGGENCDYRGFVYDTSTHADPGNVAPAASGYAWNWTEGGSFGAATFDHGLTGLTQGQLYYYRSCCHNSVGWDYGNTEESFTTKPEAPTSFNAHDATTSTIDLSWTKGIGAVHTYIRGEDGSYPADRTDGYLVYDDTGTSCQDSGLTAGHRYYYRAWSWVSGTVYSDGYAQDNEMTLYTTPAVTLATPATGDRGATAQVETIDGSGFTGVTSVSFGAGITVTSFIVDSDIQITANIDIAWDATLGLRDVSATNSGGTGTLTDGFTVDAPAPVITAVVPDSGNKGETGYDVVIAGTGFIDTSAVDFGADITVTGFVVDSYAMITATLDIDGAATTGFHDVSVTTPGGMDTSVGGFEITEGGTLPTMLMAMVGLAGTLTFVSWRARFIVVSMASALVWFAMGAIIMISPSTFDMGTWGTQWTIMLAMVFILMTFAPLLLQMRTDIRHEQIVRGKTMTWTTSGQAPNGKLTRRQESQMRQADFRRNLRNRWTRK